MNTGTPWVPFGANPRAAAVPWLTQEESQLGVLYLARGEHKETFYQLCQLANADRRSITTRAGIAS